MAPHPFPIDNDADRVIAGEYKPGLKSCRTIYPSAIAFRRTYLRYDTR